MDKSQIAIVDPYYTHLVNQFNNKNTSLIALFSDFEFNDVVQQAYNLDLSIFDEVFYLRSDEEFDACINSLKKSNITQVVNGFDTGARLWVKVCNALELKNAPPLALEKVLRNKFDTIKYLRDKGILVAKNFLINQDTQNLNTQDLVDYIGLPMVIKPTESASSYGVKVCVQTEDIAAAINSVIGTIDIMGTTVEQLVAEEFLSGKECAVCTVSYGGIHKIPAVYTYDETIVDGIKFVRTISLAKPEDTNTRRSIDYALQVLEALEYQRGQAAIEVMVSEEDIKLVEFNPRVGGLGGLLDDMVKCCSGNSHVNLTAESIYDYEVAFKQAPDIYINNKYGKILFLQIPGDCIANSLENIEKIKQLPSVISMKIKVEIGDTLTKTVDVNNSPGLVLLVNCNEDDLNRDIRAIEQYESNNLFS